MRFLIEGYDLSGHVQDWDIRLGSYGNGSSCSVTVKDAGVRNILDLLSRRVGGLISLDTSTPERTAAKPPVSTPDSNSPVNVSTDTGTSNLFPSYPTPADERSRILGIIRECLRQGLTDPNQIAYVLATVKHECGNINGWYAPVEEINGANLRYAPYYGRGLVQLTWLFNYKRYQEITGLPLVSEPNRVIEDFGLSAFVLVHGFRTGTFTGKKITDYIGGGRVDFAGARRCINGTDKQYLIAGYARDWLRRLPSYLASAKGNTQPISNASPSQSSSLQTTNPEPLKTQPVIITLTLGSDSWSFYYQGYRGNDNSLVISGKGLGFQDSNLPKYLTDTTLYTLASQLGVRVNSQEDDITFSALINRSDRLLTQVNAIAQQYGYRLDVNGSDVSIKKVTDYRTVTITDVSEVNYSDATIDQLPKQNDTALARPGSLVVPMNTIYKPGDRIITEYLPSDTFWVATQVSHNSNGTTLISYATPLVADLVESFTQSQNQTQAIANPINPTNNTLPTGNLKKMLDSALANRGKDTSISGLNGGRLACAWAINRFVLEPVFGRKFGSLPNLVISVEDDMKNSGFVNVGRDRAVPGCIAVAVRKGNTGAHIGIVTQPNADPVCLSNSSSRAAFVAEYNWERIMSKTYHPARFAYYQPPNS